jgi:tetratricopeptide (TPR) repeat protein
MPTLAIAAGYDGAVARLARARSLAAIGARLEQALEDADIAQKATGDNLILSRTRAFAFAKLGRHAEARPVVRAALALNPNDVDMLLYDAVYAMEDGDPATARVDLLRLDERDALLHPGLILLARALLQLEDFVAAAAALDRCLAHDADDREARGSRCERAGSWEIWTA